MQTGDSLYALSWSPDSEAVVVGAGRDLAIKGLQVQTISNSGSNPSSNAEMLLSLNIIPTLLYSTTSTLQLDRRLCVTIPQTLDVSISKRCRYWAERFVENSVCFSREFFT